MKSLLLRGAAILAAAFFALAAPLSTTAQAADAPHDPILGSGSSWAANAIAQWVADVNNQHGWRVDFNAVGAARGRQEFAIPKTDFGVSDIGYQGVDPAGNPDTSNGRAFAYLPIAAGGTALPYHLEVGGQLIKNVRLSGETVAKIFTGQIQNWNDAAITADNNGHGLPSIPIIPVVHSEGAGVTNQFTAYLANQYPSIWGPCNGGQAEATEYFPLNCGADSGNMKAFNGSDGVMNFLTSPGANGAIGIEEYSYPLLKGYPSIKLLNKAGYFTLPTQYNVAVALTKAVINNDPKSQNYLTQNLDGVYVNPDKRTYPLSSYVYAIIPTAADDAYTKTTGARQTLTDFLSFSICQGQSEIGPIGYSSLPVNLVQGGFTQIAKLHAADPDVDVANVSIAACHNPTFIPGKPSQNYLAQIAPQPLACDKVGADPCGADVVVVTPPSNPNNPSDPSTPGGNGGSTNPNNPGTTDPNNPGTTNPNSPGTTNPNNPGSTNPNSPGTTDPNTPGAGAGGTTGATGGNGGTGATGATANNAGSTIPGVGSDLGLGTTGGSDVPTAANQGSFSAAVLPANAHSGPAVALTVLVIALLALAVSAPVLAGRLFKGRTR